MSAHNSLKGLATGSIQSTSPNNPYNRGISPTQMLYDNQMMNMYGGQLCQMNNNPMQFHMAKSSPMDKPDKVNLQGMVLNNQGQQMTLNPYQLLNYQGTKVQMPNNVPMMQNNMMPAAGGNMGLPRMQQFQGPPQMTQPNMMMNQGQAPNQNQVAFQQQQQSAFQPTFQGNKPF